MGVSGRKCLNAHWFLTLADAREKLEAWRRYYNEERPDGSIANKVPISLQNPRRRSQPGAVINAGNSYPPAVQRSGADQGRGHRLLEVLREDQADATETDLCRPSASCS